MNAREKNEIPIDPVSGEPIDLRAQPGYYPGYSTLKQKDHWDEATKAKVLKRVCEVPPLRFFSETEAVVLQCVLDRILPQFDREKEFRIPILNLIDDRLHAKRFDGYIFEGLPEEDEAHRLGLQGVSELSEKRHAKAFNELLPREQEEILLMIRDGKVEASAIWKTLPPQHYWSLLVQDAVSAYYSHPFAWDEIGFGGPAYPRGYMRLTRGRPEPWEVNEQRYEWLAPEFSQSDQYKNNEELFSKSSRHGEAGSH